MQSSRRSQSRTENRCKENVVLIENKLAVTHEDFERSQKGIVRFPCKRTVPEKDIPPEEVAISRYAANWQQ
jgi:hypothetical protein